MSKLMSEGIWLCDCLLPISLRSRSSGLVTLLDRVTDEKGVGKHEEV